MSARPPTTLRLLATSALAGLAAFAATAARANPSGGQVVGGSATISSTGNTLTVQQSTSRAIINWQSFDIAPGEITNFVQPSSGSIALNRVTGSQNPSQILGSLNANGQVWIINPNGVQFGAGAQVNVAGLVATSSDIDNSSFMAGNYVFSHSGNANATISNAGTITTQDAGLVAFVAPNVSNAGVINAKLGKVQLGSGDTFTLDLYGDGLISLQAGSAITQQLVSNSGTIKADGGTVTLTAAAAVSTVNSLINMSGVVQADSIGTQDGQIVIYAAGSNAATPGEALAKPGGGTSTVNVSGTLDASGKAAGETGGSISVLGDSVTLQSGALLDASGDAGGGYIKIGGNFHGAGSTPTALTTTVQNGTVIDADAITTGNGGNVAVWADYFARFAGNISAKGGTQSGNGGYVETSGHVSLSVGDTASVYTLAPNGNAGTWLLDPKDYTIAASGGDMTGATLTSNLGSGNVTILSSSGGTSGTGSIYVNDTVSWSANTLTLTAADNIVVSAVMTATGTAALNLNPATANGGDSAVSGGALSMTFAIGGGFAGRIDYSASGALKIGGTTYTVISSLGAQGSTTGTDLQGMSGNLAGHYALGANIDASATSGWNAGAGFLPVGNSTTNFTGVFEGLGHTISNLSINRSSTSYIGLFGFNGSSIINDIGISGGSVSGGDGVGGLVGISDGTISNSYATDNVTIAASGRGAGGLAGYNNGTTSNSYATGTVTGGASARNIGGLVGANGGTIGNSYATGAVSSGSGSNYVGGLVGGNASPGTISNSYATGSMSSSGSSYYIGGVVGFNQGIITNSYATGSVTGSGSTYVGGLAGYNSGGTITNSYSTGAVSGTSHVGGLAGYNGGTITNSFWDTQTSGQASSAGGTGETTAQMKTLSTFSTPGWSISSSDPDTTTWYIDPGVATPVLRTPAADMPTAFTWTGASSTAWSTAGNWFGGAAPGSGDSPIIPNSIFANNMPVLGAGTTINSLTMNSGSTLDLAGFSLTLSGTLTSTGATISSSSGNLTIASDHYSLGSGTSISDTGGTITLKEYTAGNSIGIGSSASGTVNLTDAELGYLSGGSYTFGDASAGAIDINTTASNILAKSLTVTSGGNVTVDSAMSWSANMLTLTAGGNINVDKVMTATGTAALNLNPTGTLSMAFAPGGGFAGRIDYSASGALKINGTTYTVISSLGAQGSTTGTDLQGINGSLSGYYALGANINASATSGWNAGAGFTPIGNDSTKFNGVFEGLGHTISNLTISQSGSNYIGLIGESNSSSRINDVGLTGGSITGSLYVGNLVGKTNNGTISNSYATGSVSGGSEVGGLMGGTFGGTVSNSYATGQVTGSGGNIGGLAGYASSGIITNSYATGAVSGGSNVGGLAGYIASTKRFFG